MPSERINKFQLLQALRSLANAMKKIKDLVPPGIIEQNDSQHDLCRDLALVCMHCTSLAARVADEFLKEDGKKCSEEQP